MQENINDPLGILSSKDPLGILKKKDGGGPKPPISTSQYVSPLPQEELPLGIPQQKRSVSQEAQTAREKINKSISESDDILTRLIRENRLSAFETQQQTIPQLDGNINPAAQSAKRFLITQSPVTPEEVVAKKQEALSDDKTARQVLARVAKKDPTIASSAYIVDAQSRAVPEKENQILANADKIARGELTYNINSGILQQPQGAIESGIRGFKERSRQLEDYERIVNTTTPEEKIKILEEGFASYDPDKPVPIPEGATAQFAEMFGMEGIPMVKSAAAATITGLIPGAQPAAPLVAAFAASPEYYKRSYESGLRSAYYELRQRGKTPEEALAIAEDQAQKEGVIGAAEGAVSSALGARIGFKPASIVQSPVVKGALERAVIASGNVVKQMAPEAAADAGAAGLLQIASNITARDNGLDRGVFDGVQENVAGEVGFTVGMGILTKGGRRLVDRNTYRTILNGFARQPKSAIDEKIGEMVVTGAMTPEDAVEVSRTIELERGLDAQIPKTIPEAVRPQVSEMIEKRNDLKQQLASANEAFHPTIKEEIKSIDQQILSYATNQSQVQEGRTEGDLGQPQGIVQGQPEVGQGAGQQGQAQITPANVGDSNIGSQGAVVTLAPFFDTTVKTAADAQALRQTPEYKRYVESIPTVAKAFGLNVNAINETIGGFENAQGNRIVEISNRVFVDSADLNQVEKFAAIMGTMTPETQEATIAAKFIAENETVPEGEYVEQLTVKVSDVDKSIEALQEAGIFDFTIDESDGSVSFLDFSQGTDAQFDEKIANFERALQNRNIQYEEAGRSPVQSKYISPERRTELITAIKNDAAGLQQGGESLRAIIAEAEQRDKAFRGEFAEELTQELVTDPISKAAQSLKSTGVSIDLIEDPVEYDTMVEQLGGQRGTEGVFLSNEGRILLNKSKLNDAITAGRIVWHESSHPVINIIRNTNPELYNRVISGMKASDNPAVQRAIQWANDNYQGQGVIDDESIVEAIAMVADGTLDLNTVPTGLKQSIIDFINLIARALGFNQVLNDTDVAAFKKLAGQVADVLTSGRDVAEVVGRENVSNFDSGRLQARGTQTDNNPAFFENIKDFANESSFANKVAFKEAVQEKLKSYIPELRKIYGRKFDPSVYNEDTRKYLSDVLTKEASNAIAAHPEAIGWYDEKTQSALAAISAIHPEIATDMEARGAFILPLAVMSNGNKVDKNFDYAEEQYRVYKDTGRYNPNGDFGAQQVGIKKSLKLINALLDNGLTMSEVSNFLTSKHKAGDLKYRKPDGKLGDLVSGELATEDVYGAVILGPKIGNGFYMNLWGEFDQLTMDRWFMRTWGRLTGTLIERDKDLISNGKKRIASAIQSIKSDKEASRILKSAIGSVSGRSASDIANAIEKVSAKKDVRNLLSSNEKTDEIRKAGNGLAKLLRGEKEAPSNGEERKFIRNVFSDVQRRLKEESGVDITMADLQAVMWYPEKILYESFKEGESFEGASEGYTEDSAPDYFNAAKKIAKKLGATDEQINQAVSEGRRYPAERAGRRDTSTGETVGRDDQEVLRQIRQIKGGAADLTKRSRPQASVGNRDIYSQVLSDDIINSVRASLRKKAPESTTLQYLDELQEAKKNDELLNEGPVADMLENGVTLNDISDMLIEDEVFEDAAQVRNYFNNIGGLEGVGIIARIQASVGARPENNPNFKLGAFVMRKKAEGATDGEIAIAIASVTGMKPEDIKTLIDNPEQYIRDMFPSMTKLQQDNLIQKAKIQNIYRGRQFGKPIDKAFTGLEVPQEYIDEYMQKTANADSAVKKWATDFKRKWLDPAKGLPDWVLAIKDFASGSKNIEIARAAKTIERLKDEAKKIGFTDWDAFGKALVVAKDVKRYIPNEDGVVPFDAYRAEAGKMFTTPDDMLPAVVPDEIKALPDEIIPYAYAMRGQIDNLTRDLIGYGYVTPEQAVNLENNIGQYVNRSYRLFNEMGYKPEPEVMNAAIKFLADDYVKKLATDKVGAVADQRIYEEAIDLAKKDVDAILNKKKNPYFNASVDRRNTGVLQERQDIPAPLRKLMGEYTDPGTVFMMTVAKQAALKGSSQYLNKLRENGMGTLFFEQNDPSRPASHSVQIAAAGTESMNPLGGLFTTPEIAEAIEMAEPTYNELTQAWMKLVGAVRWGKTVGSIATQFKNFESNMGFAVLNGYLMSGQNTPAFKAAGKYVKGQYSKAEIDAITEKAIKLNLVGQSVGARELKEMLGSGDVHDIALDIALSPEGKWGRKVAKKLNIFKEANKLYRLGDDFWKVYAYMTEREQLSDARFSSKYEDLTKEQQEQIDVESSERVKNTWPTYDRVIEGAKAVSKRAPIFGNFISFQAESLRVLANSIKLAKQDMADPQLRHLGVRRAVGIAAYFGLRAAITIGLAKAAGFAAAGVLGAAFGDDEEERNKRAIKQALPPFMRTSDLAVIRTKEPHKFTVISLSSLDPYAIIPNSLNAYTEGREGIFGKTMDPGVAAATTELFSSFLEPEMTFSTMWSVINNIDPKTKQEIVLSSDSDAQAAAKVGGKVWDMLEPSSVALVQRFFERKDKEAEVLALGGARPYDVDLHKSFGYILSQFGKDVDAINREYNSLKYRDISQNEKNAAEMAAEDKKAFAISKLNETYRDFINLGADPKVLNELINQRSSIKMTGFDKNTKKFIKTGNINKKTLFK